MSSFRCKGGRRPLPARRARPPFSGKPTTQGSSPCCRAPLPRRGCRRSAVVLLCWLFLLAVSALSPVGGQVPRNIDIKVDVSNIDELYQALLGQASEILVDNNILADDQLYKVLKPFSLPAEDTSGLGDDGARIDWLVPFTLQDSTGSGSRASSSRPAPVEDSYFPPVINHSTRLVCGIPGGGRCMLAGRGRGERAFLIRSGGTLYLEGFQLSEWATTTGGAIRVDSGGRAILVNCILNNNKAEANGASLGGEAPDVSDAWGLNGALWSLRSAGGAVLVAGGGSFEATDVVFERNEAKDTDPDGTFGSGGFGGAIAVLGMGSKMRCTRCSFISNTAGSAGGAVALAEGGIAAMQGGGGTFNQAELAGGLVALLGQGSRLEVSEFNMEENFARSGPGGCVAAHGGGHVLIKSSRLMKNEASGSYGGAIALDASSQGFLDSSNLQRNTAAGNGGGLSIAGASRALLVNTTVAACDALEGGAIDVAGEGSELELGLGCLLNENTAGAHGGHLSVRDGGLATSQGTRFRRGTSEGVGGGGIVVVGRASAFVGEELRFQDNKAMNGGIGGGMLISGGMVAIRGGKILGNSASIGGAGHVEAGGKLVLSGRLQLLENVVGPGTHGTELSLDDSSHLVADGLEIQPSGGLTGATILVSGPSRAVLWHVTFIRPSTSRRLLQQTRVDILVDNEQKAMVAVREAVGSPVPHIQSLSGDSMDEVLGACLPLTCMGSAPSADGACQLPPDRFVNDMPSEALLPDFGCKSSLQRSIATSLPVISANNAPNCMMEDPAPGELCGEGGLVMLKSTKCLEGDYCDPNLEVPPPSPPPPPPPPPATPMVTEDPNIFLLPESAEPPTVSPAPTPVRESNAGIPTFKPGPEVDPIIGNPIQISYPGAVVSTDPTADGAKLPTQGPGLDQVKEDGSEIIEPAPRPPQPRQEPGISTRFIVLIAAGILFVLLVGGATSVIVWRAGVARNKSQQRDEGAWPRDSRAMGLSQPALDFTQSSPYSTNTSGTGTPQKDSDKSLPKAKAFKWRTCYAFLPCGSIDMLYGDSDHGEHGPRLDAVQVKGQPGVFRPPKPHGQLIQHPELPHFAPKDWGRSSIYLTLPARLDDLDGQRELSAGLSAVRSSLASDDANTKGTGLRRRLSCPDSFSSLVMLPSTLEVPSMPPSHRTIKLHHTIVAATKAAMMPMAEAKPHVPFDGTAIVRGLSHSEWAQAGLVEIDFNTEIKPYLKNQIGSGAFGDVFLATWRGCDVAVKIFNRGFAGATGEQAESFRQEVLMMTRLGRGCRQIVSIYGASFKQPNMALVYQYIPGGSLYERIHKSDKPPLTYLEVLKIGMDLASALSFLHPSVVHRDLKPMNILLDSDGTAMLIDFGVSRERDPAHSYFNTRAGGTPAYMAPEMFNGDKFDEKVDVFALACILCECMSCQSPWDGATNFGMIVYTVSIMDERPDIPEDCPDRMRRLINRCWEKDPHGRPSCYEIAHKLKAMIRTEEARIKQEAEKLTRIEDEDPAQDEVRMVMSQASIGTSANSLSSSIPPSPLPLADHRRPPIVER